MNSCIMIVPSVSTKAVPPFAFERQKMIEMRLHSRQTTISTIATAAHTMLTTIPKTRQTAVTTTANSTQKNHDHQLHFFTWSHPQEMHLSVSVAAPIDADIGNVVIHASIGERSEACGGKLPPPICRLMVIAYSAQA